MLGKSLSRAVSCGSLATRSCNWWRTSSSSWEAQRERRPYSHREPLQIFWHAHGCSRFNLRVPSGAVYGFLGRNGAGKTTTMRVLLGLMHPTSGRARVCGLDPARERTRVQILQRVAYLPQRKQLYSPMTVQELVRCNRGFFPRWSNELAAHTAKALDIPMRTPF